MSSFKIRLGMEKDVPNMNNLDVDIGGDVAWDDKRVYHVALVNGKIVGYFGLAYLSAVPYAFGSGLAVEEYHRKQGIGSALMYAGLMEARRRKVEWIGTTTMYYNFWFFHNRGWYAVKRKDLWGFWKDYEPFFENMKVMPMLRPMGKYARAVRLAGSLENWLKSQEKGFLKLDKA